MAWRKLTIALLIAGCQSRGASQSEHQSGSAAARTPIPTTRGVQSLAVADLDGDGHPEIVIADGWHQNYARSARGLLTWAHHTSAGYKSELIEDTAGQYSVGRIGRIVIARIDGHPAVVTAGSQYVRVFARVGEHWQGFTIAGAARDVAVGDLDGLPGDEIPDARCSPARSVSGPPIALASPKQRRASIVLG